jgi:glycosyltransferase involved in cell wall biosynthesis
MEALLNNFGKRAYMVVRDLLLMNDFTRQLSVKAYQSLINSKFFTKRVNDAYIQWVRNNYPTQADLVEMTKQIENFRHQPLISVIIPTYNTTPQFLAEAIDSVIHQAYANWELVIIDDCSTNPEVREVITHYCTNDNRIKAKFLDENLHIAGATNVGIELATGGYICLFDHDDLLWSNALYEVVKTINEHPDADFIYSDEDKVTEISSMHFAPYFKPDWNYEFLRGLNYITHLAVIRKSLLEKIGGEDGKYNGAQDWELFLRISRHTDKIYHIPTILYSWRMHSGSTAESFDTKPYLVEAQKNALKDDLLARGFKEFELVRDIKNNGWNTILQVSGAPKVSIVIPTKDSYEIVKRCVESIYAKTTYRNFEIVLVDTGSTDQRVHEWYAKLTAQQVEQQVAQEAARADFKVVEFIKEKFSYADACIFGASIATGEHLLMLNNDTEVLTASWIEQMLGDSQRADIGAVGVMLLFPKDATTRRDLLFSNSTTSVANESQHDATGAKRFSPRPPRRICSRLWA